MPIEPLELGEEPHVERESIQDSDRIVRIGRRDESVAGIVDGFQVARRNETADAGDRKVLGTQSYLLSFNEASAVRASCGAAEIRFDRERVGQRFRCFQLVATTRVRQTQVVVVSGFEPILLNARLEKRQSKCGQVLLVVNEAQRIVDLGGVRQLTLGRLRKLQRDVEVPAILSVNPRKVIRSDCGVRIELDHLFISLLRACFVALRLHDDCRKRERGHRLRVPLRHSFELGQRFREASLLRVQLS